jgi:hypothetical protein
MKLMINLKKLPKRDILIFGLLAFLFFATSRSIAHPEFFRVHDYVHAARIAEITRAASDGHLPVRWSQNFGYGYGMPLFEFYAPLPYYVGGLFYWLSGQLLWSVKLLFLIANLGSIVGSYLLGRELFGRKGGVIVTTAYSLAPYRAVNLFVRGAVSESWGMMAMPWVLWAGIRFFRFASQTRFKNKAQHLIKHEVTKSWWLLVISLVVLFLSHNLSTLMFAPISLIVTGVIGCSMLGKLDKPAIHSILKWLGAYGLAVGLAAFYLFPAFLEKDFTIIGEILSGYFNPSHHFLYIRQFFTPNWAYGGSAWGPNDDISFFLGYGQLLAAAFSLLIIRAAVMKKYRRLQKNSRSSNISLKKWLSAQTKVLHFRYFFLFGLVTVGAMFLSILKSKWLWDVLPLISFIQFPWRWLSIVILFLSLLGGYGLILVTNPKSLKIVIIGLLGVMLLNLQYFRPEKYLDNSADFYYSDAQLIRTQMSGILPDYIPNTLVLSTLQPRPKAGEVSKPALPNNTAGDVIYQPDKWGDAEVLINRVHQKLVSIDINAPGDLVFAVASYPGWKAEINGKAAETAITTEGLVQVRVPAGSSKVGIYFGSTPVRHWSDILTAASILTAIFLSIQVKTTKTTK